MATVRWECYSHIAQSPHARVWLTTQANLGLAANTVAAYGRGLEDYLAFLTREQVHPETAGRATIAAYVRDLASRPTRYATAVEGRLAHGGLANATLQQRLTIVRLYYTHLVEEGIRQENPVGHGRYTAGSGFAGERGRSLLPRYRKLPWIPTEEQWQHVLTAVRQEPLRNRVMFAFAYDGALRRQELCFLEIDDIDPAHRLVRIRAETSKNHQERVIPYSEATGQLYAAYVRQRRLLSHTRGRLFLSLSPRNHASPLGIWTWSKVVAGMAARSGVRQFTTHTLRHLCLTDLARVGWDLHEIATFAGHRSLESTLRYIHLSGRDLATKLGRSMADIHAARTQLLGELLL